MKQLLALKLPLDGIPVYRNVTPMILRVPIYTPEWKETIRGKVSCLRKQHVTEGPNEPRTTNLTILRSKDRRVCHLTSLRLRCTYRTVNTTTLLKAGIECKDFNNF